MALVAWVLVLHSMGSAQVRFPSRAESGCRARELGGHHVASVHRIQIRIGIETQYLDIIIIIRIFSIPWPIYSICMSCYLYRIGMQIYIYGNFRTLELYVSLLQTQLNLHRDVMMMCCVIVWYAFCCQTFCFYKYIHIEIWVCSCYSPFY